MSYWSGAPIDLLLPAFALIDRKLSHSILTGPMLFAAVGFAIGPQVPGADPWTGGRQRR